MTNQRTTGFAHEHRIADSVEWYTPPEIFEALGVDFDLDPAAPPGGVPWIPATHHYSTLDDGLSRPWGGLVWLNPPYGRQTGRWLDRLARHGEGLALVFARTDTAWFQGVANSATSLCFLADRLRFVRPDGQPAAAAAGAGSLLVAYGLTASLALASAGLGPVFPITSAQCQTDRCSLANLRMRNEDGDEGLRMRNATPPHHE